MNTSLFTEEIERKLAFTEAYESYRARLNSYALFKTNDYYRSEDLVQTAFMKAWVYLRKNETIDNMKGFLYYILNHLIVDEYRKRKVVSLDILLEKGFEPEANDTEEHTFNILDGKRAVLLLKRLPEHYREVLQMRYVQGLSPKEIASLTGQTANMVAVLTCRGLEKLKTLYNHPS